MARLVKHHQTPQTPDPGIYARGCSRDSTGTCLGILFVAVSLPILCKNTTLDHGSMLVWECILRLSLPAHKCDLIAVCTRWE